MTALVESHAPRPKVGPQQRSPRSGFFMPVSPPPKAGTGGRNERSAEPRSLRGSVECLSRIPRSPRCTARTAKSSVSLRGSSPSFPCGSTTPRPSIPPHCSMRSAPTSGSSGRCDPSVPKNKSGTTKGYGPPSPCLANVESSVESSSTPAGTPKPGSASGGRSLLSTAATSTVAGRPTQHWFLTSGNFSAALEAALASPSSEGEDSQQNHTEYSLSQDDVKNYGAVVEPRSMSADSVDNEVIDDSVQAGETAISNIACSTEDDSRSKSLLSRTRAVAYELMYKHQRRKANKGAERVEELSRETASLRQKMDDLRASRTAALSIIRNQRAELSTETARVAMLEGKAGEVPGLRAALEAAQKDAEEQRAERKADMGAMQAADKALGSARRRIAELEEQNATLTEQVVEQAGRLAGAHKRSASAVQELQEAQASSMKLEMELRERKAMEEEIAAAREANARKDEELTRERGRVAVLSAQFKALRASVTSRAAAEPPTWELLKEGELSGKAGGKMNLKQFSAKPKRTAAPVNPIFAAAFQQRSSPFAQGAVVKFSSKKSEAAAAY